MPEKFNGRFGFDGDHKQIEIEVPDGKPTPWDLDSKRRVIGKDVPRLDGPLKSTGRARYTADISRPGMLYMKTLRSPHAAAKVLSVDVEDALAMPGVKAARAVAGTRVTYVGDEVAVVAAETEAQAANALNAIVVRYEKLPAALDAATARQEGAPQVFERQPNVVPDAEKIEGDVDAAFASAAQVLKATYETQSQLHTSLEPHGSVVEWHEDGTLVVYTSTQATFGVRQNLARSLELEPSSVRVICEHMGGGFGSKFAPGPFTLHAIELARVTGKPVKAMLDRREELLIGGSRPDSLQQVEIAASAEGEFLGARVASWGTAGITRGAGVQNPKIYNFKNNIKKTHEDVYTNRAASCAFRAPGHPQGIFALESAIDELADKLSMDPLELRRKNDPSAIRRRQYDLGAEAIGWSKRRHFVAGVESDSALMRGFGMASALWYNAGRDGWKVDVEIFPSGHVLVKNGAQDIGTGTRTILAICVAEELGLEPTALEVRLGDTNDPPGPGSGGSATAPCLAPTARDAGFMAARELLILAAAELERPIDQLEIAPGVIRARDGSAQLSFKEACALIASDSLMVSAKRDPNYGGYDGVCCGVQFAEVEVDTETGVVRVVKVVAVQDAGIILDRLTFTSQVTGGVIQGLSFALFEERLIDPHSGNLVNADLLHYKLVGAMDMPEIVVIPMDVANGFNSTSTMGVGEPPIIPTAGAIANAVANACGARVRSLPITPWKVLEALGRTREWEERR